MMTKQSVFLGTFSILYSLSQCSHTTSKVGSVNGLGKYDCCILSWPNLVCREVERGERKEEERRLGSRGGGWKG